MVDARDLSRLAADLVATCADGIGLDSQLLPACTHLLESGGKHLRPRLVLAAAATGPESESESVWNAVLAVELLHSASLAHDDVLDDASARRGRKSVGSQFGVTTAALMGGWLCGRGACLAARGGDGPTDRF